MNDAQLIEEFRRGNTAAFNTLVNRWQKRIHCFAYRWFCSHDEASEITQKTFIKAYRKLSTLKDTEKFTPWIYRIASNLCKDEAKRAGRRRSAPMEELAHNQHLQKLSDNPERKLQRRQLDSFLQQALDQLPEEQRMVVIMKEYEGLKFREIAEILEVPENTVKSRMYYGLAKLRDFFEKSNIEMEAYYYE